MTCPHCGSDNIEFKKLVTDTTSTVRVMACKDCDREFVDTASRRVHA